MLVPLFALALSLQPTEQLTNVEVSAGADVSYYDIRYPGGGDARAIGGDGGLALKLYVGEPLKDDPAPLSLQPFLQRASSVTLSGGGGGFDFQGPVWNRHGTSGDVGFAASGYPHRNVHLAASFAAHYDSWQDVDWFGGGFPGLPVTTSEKRWSLPIFAAVGVRFHDVLIEAGWGVTPTRRGNADFEVPFWGGATLDATMVFGRRTEVRLGAAATDRGARGGVFGERFFGRRLGIWLHVFGGHQVVDHVPQNWLGGDIGASYWLSRRLKVELSYGPEWVRFDSPEARTVILHQINLTFVARF